MIIKLNKEGHVGIPTVTKDGFTEYIDLVPSYSEIPDEKWALCRPNALRIIESGNGMITEEFTKVDKEKAKDYPASLVLECKDAGKVLVPAKLADIIRGDKLLAIIKNTYHIPTLKKLYSEELRADIRVELQKQLDAVESGSIKG